MDTARLCYQHRMDDYFYPMRDQCKYDLVRIWEETRKKRRTLPQHYRLTFYMQRSAEYWMDIYLFCTASNWICARRNENIKPNHHYIGRADVAPLARRSALAGALYRMGFIRDISDIRDLDAELKIIFSSPP